jgi:HAMP domain-containing protein
LVTRSVIRASRSAVIASACAWVSWPALTAAAIRVFSAATSWSTSVESAKVLDRLRAAGCDIAQGYHIARPQPPKALTGWLDVHHPADVLVP